MNIVVCIKQVPDTTDIKFDPESNTLSREGVESIINPFDMYAIEEALRIKEKLGGKVTALSMGPPQVADALRTAISLGLDEAILLSDKAFAGADTWATSLTLAGALRKMENVGLILMGKQAMDGDTGQVGPGVAEHLKLPHITDIRKIEEISEEEIVCQRLLEDGSLRLKAQLPIVMTVVKEINEPRLPSLRGQMAARKAEITTWNAEALGIPDEESGLNGSPTQVTKIFTPPKLGGGEVFEGEPEDTVTQLLAGLKAGGILLGSAKEEQS